MNNIFYLLYVFFNRHKKIFFAAFFTLLAISLYFVCRIKLHEDIMGVIPKNKEVNQVNKAFEDFRLGNRLVLHLYYRDKGSADPQGLIAAAHQLNDSLQGNYAAYIDDVKLEFPDSNIELLYNYYNAHLPVYLEEADYQRIEERTSEKGIQETVAANYKALMSPMSMVTKKMLLKDPFGFTSFPLERANKLRMEDNIKLYQNHLLTADQQHLVFFIMLANPPGDTGKNGVFLNGLDGFAQQLQAKVPGLQVEYFGHAAVSAANAKQIKHDIMLTVGIAIIGLFIFISLFYRSLSIFFLALTPGIFGSVIAVAFLALYKGQVSAISLGVGSVLLGVTIDYALHFITHFKHEKNLKALFSDMAAPLLICCFTTAAAFFALIFISSDALADLGIFSGISIIGAALYTLLVLPQFIISGQEEKVKAVQGKNIVEKLVDLIASYPFHRRKWALGLFLVLSGIFLFTWRNYAFETNMLKLNFMPDNLATYEKNLNQISGYSSNSVYLVSKGKNLWEALEAEKAVKNKLQGLQDKGLIKDYLAVSNMVPPRSVQQERLQRWNNYWKSRDPDKVLTGFYKGARETGFQTTAFSGFEQSLKSKPALMEAADVEPLLSVFGDDFIMRKGDSVSVISTARLDIANKEAVLKELSTLEGALILDKGYFTSRLIDLLQEDFNVLVNIDSVIVFLVLLIIYGRFELAVVAYAPIILSWLWILGLMGLFGLKFNIVNIVITTFIFGLGVDYSVFVMQGLTQRYKQGVNHFLSYKRSIIVSAVTTLIGIGVLAFGQHPALRSIAALAIIGNLSVIFLIFTIQPVLYDFLILKRKEKGLLPFTLSSLLLSTFAFLYFLSGCMLLMVFRLVLFMPLGSLKFRKRIFHFIMMLFCRSLIYIMANVRKEVVGLGNIDFSKPSVIISNHHSFLDIVLLLMFSPKVVMVTNSWVYNSPFFGLAVRFADFIDATKGVENQLDKIGNLVKEGYSIIVFPEGTRSASAKIGRFHKGAFYLANEFKLDIQPVILHGTDYTMPKKDGFYLRNGNVTVKFLPRIKYGDPAFGTTYTEQTKLISRYFKAEYQQLRDQQEYPAYFKETLIKNYIFKGPVLEWYLRVKYRLEGSYNLFHDLVPKTGKVIDLGCGYGFMSYALALSSENRSVLGIDYDFGKIEVAKNCPVVPANLAFDHGDVTTYPYGEADTFIVSDVMHYLVPEEQVNLLNNMAAKLLPGGKIIVRDGDSSKQERHKGTKLTEVFSTGTGFNKTKNELHYLSKDLIEDFALANNFELEIIDNTKLTSNTVFVLMQQETDGKV